MEGIARAHSNIALIKYWGKRDEARMLPANGSLSMTLDAFHTTTRVAFRPDLAEDTLILNGRPASEPERQNVARFLTHVRAIAGTKLHAAVTSDNAVPTAAGLASSASGFAALATAAANALSLNLNDADLSRLARQGSGSACRSVYGGFVEWRRGEREDGQDSFAVQVAPTDHWELHMLATFVGGGRKTISSREGMRRTVQTSPFYAAWLSTIEDDLKAAREAILARDIEALGSVAEANAMRMHATTLAAIPPFTYWQEATLAVMREVEAIRKAGVPAWFTIDAGPNVVVFCEAAQSARVREALLHVQGVLDVVDCRPGPGVSDGLEVAE